ncbi:hypothetical protein [Aquibacillus kalidii]|uniref:hypothetical protein n=1 Tax=Aquibacillus kalidii TaxID=2762597 RepID=UPI0016492D44|nr:hypothetical protein [Aquibacillus kalidii]
MKRNKLILLGMLVLPWLSFPLLGKKTVKRFICSSIFISLIVKAESILARKRKWWWFFEKITPNFSGELPLIWGPFFIGSMWIMKFTYGKYLLYMLINFLIDAFFSFVLIDYLKKLGIGALVRLKKYQLLLIFLFKANLLYIFQILYEKTWMGNSIESNK